jgi:hypothetical protein
MWTGMAGKVFDNRSPRTIHECIKSDQTLDKGMASLTHLQSQIIRHVKLTLETATKERITRAEGAQQNGFENIGLFAAAVVAGNIAKLDNRTLNMLSGTYVASRLLYNYIYLTNDTESKGERV